MRIVVCAAALIAAAGPAGAATAIGSVERIVGTCTGTVDGADQNLAAAGSVYLDEKITCGDGARLAVKFDDGTSLTVGEKSQLSLDQFIYTPDGDNKFHAAVVGAFRYISGSHDASRQASITTAVATIGVRGTDFWGGPLDAGFGVVLLDGAITVTTPGGSFDLDAIDTGVDISGPSASVTNWSDEKRERALDTVSFR